MRFLLDHNVPAAVGDMLRNRGHDIVAVTDVLPQDAADPIFTAAAIAEDRVLVSHDRDMKKVERLISDGYRDSFPILRRLHLSCNEVTSAVRVKDFIEVIELEFATLQKRGAAMTIDVGDRRMRLIR